MPRRALVVDGEPRTRKLLEEIFLPAGIEIVTVAASPEAPAPLQEGKFDLVLVDLSLHPAEGLALIRKIRHTGFNRKTPIVMIDDAGQGTLSLGFSAGASFLIYKPVDRVRLTRLVRVTQGAMEHERRCFQRVPVRDRVRLEAAGAHTEGETVDLSMNGMLVRTARIFPAGSVVDVALFAGGGPKPIMARGSVARVVGTDQMGIQLDDLSVKESQRLQSYLLPLVDR